MSKPATLPTCCAACCGGRALSGRRAAPDSLPGSRRGVLRCSTTWPSSARAPTSAGCDPSSAPSPSIGGPPTAQAGWAHRRTVDRRWATSSVRRPSGRAGVLRSPDLARRADLCVLIARVRRHVAQPPGAPDRNRTPTPSAWEGHDAHCAATARPAVPARAEICTSCHLKAGPQVEVHTAAVRSSLRSRNEESIGGKRRSGTLTADYAARPLPGPIEGGSPREPAGENGRSRGRKAHVGTGRRDAG